MMIISIVSAAMSGILEIRVTVGRHKPSSAVTLPMRINHEGIQPYSYEESTTESPISSVSEG